LAAKVTEGRRIVVARTAQNPPICNWQLEAVAAAGFDIELARAIVR
jgi:hypothetical protein